MKLIDQDGQELNYYPSQTEIIVLIVILTAGADATSYRILLIWLHILARMKA